MRGPCRHAMLMFLPNAEFNVRFQTTLSAQQQLNETTTINVGFYISATQEPLFRSRPTPDIKQRLNYPPPDANFPTQSFHPASQSR